MKRELAEAIMSNRIKFVKNLIIKEGADINAEHGLNALQIATIFNCVDIVKLLLEQGAQVDLTVSSSRKTALHFAAKNGLTEIAKLLLEQGAQVDLTDSDGNTALDLAAENGRTKIAKLLISIILSKNTEEIKPTRIESNEQLSDFWNKIQLEAKNLRAYLSNNVIYCSMDQFFTEDPSKLAERFTQKNINNLSQAMANSEFRETLPNWFSSVESRLETLKPLVEKRMKYLALSDKLTLSSDNGEVTLTKDVQWKICRGLPENDIKSLLRSSLLPPVSESKSQAFNQDTLTARLFSLIASCSVQ